jgi:hypothetical protein
MAHLGAMTNLTFALYALMAIWLLLAAGRRIALTLATGNPIDPITFISAALGAIALIAAYPAWDHHHHRKKP